MIVRHFHQSTFEVHHRGGRYTDFSAPFAHEVAAIILDRFVSSLPLTEVVLSIGSLCQTVLVEFESVLREIVHKIVERQVPGFLPHVFRIRRFIVLHQDFRLNLEAVAWDDVILLSQPDINPGKDFDRGNEAAQSRPDGIEQLPDTALF